MSLTVHLHLVPMMRMDGVIPPLTLMPIGPTQRQFCILLWCICVLYVILTINTNYFPEYKIKTDVYNRHSFCSLWG